jgi:hypothetical protein
VLSSIAGLRADHIVGGNMRKRHLAALAAVAAVAVGALGGTQASGRSNGIPQSVITISPVLATGAVPSATFDVNYDNVTAPCDFVNTAPLGKLMGVKFKGKKHGGGAILNQCGNFGIANFSAPNFLAFNCHDTYPTTGGKASLPETMSFGKTDIQVGATLNVFSTEGHSMRVTIYNAAGASGFADFTPPAGGSHISIGSPINKIVLSSTPGATPECVAVTDDLIYSK